MSFPLALTPFERYLACDDRRQYPMTFTLQVLADGAADRSALADAFERALQRNPLLCATIVKQQWGRSELPPRLRWLNAPCPASDLDEPIDIERRPGLVASAFVRDGQTELTFRFHHAATDGLGGLRFIGDLLAIYGALTSQPGDLSPRLHAVDPSLLSDRGRLDLTFPEPVPASEAFRFTCSEGWKTIMRSAAPMAGVPQKDPVRTPEIPVLHLPPAIYRSLQLRAQDLGVTTNDLLLRDMYRTICDWHVRLLRRPAEGWLRIALPTSLRGPRDAAMPAANLLGYAMMNRRASDCDEDLAMLSQLAQETRMIREWSTGAVFVHAINLMHGVPGMLPFIVGAMRYFATMVFSNLGNPVHRFAADFPQQHGRIIAGNLTINSIFGVPPIRPGTRMSVMLSTYGGGLAIGLNADPRWYDASLIQSFLSRYGDRLEKTSERPAPANAAQPRAFALPS